VIPPGDTASVTLPPWSAPGVGTFGVQCIASAPTDSGGVSDTLTAVVSVVASSSDPIVTAVEPGAGAYSGFTTIQIVGANFLPGAAVELRRAGYPPIVSDPALTLVIDSTRIRAPVDLRDAVAGMRDVVARNPDGREGVLFDAFRIEPPYANLLASLLGRGTVRAGIEAEYWSISTNAGNSDLDSLVSIISFPREVVYRDTVPFPPDTLGVHGSDFSSGLSDSLTMFVPILFSDLSAGMIQPLPIWLTAPASETQGVLTTTPPLLSLRVSLLRPARVSPYLRDLQNSCSDAVLADPRLQQALADADVSYAQFQIAFYDFWITMTRGIVRAGASIAAIALMQHALAAALVNPVGMAAADATFLSEALANTAHVVDGLLHVTHEAVIDRCVSNATVRHARAASRCM